MEALQRAAEVRGDAAAAPAAGLEAGAGPAADAAAVPDFLLECLVEAGRVHLVEVDREAVVAGLPLEAGRLTPGLLLCAAQRAGFRARLVERKLRKLPKSVLPAILLLKGGRAGVLSRKSPADAVEFHIPGDPAHVTQTAPLKRDYTGFTVLLQPQPSAEAIPAPNPRWWFWLTMWKLRGQYLRLLPASALMAVFAMVMPIFTMLVYDRVVPNDAAETLAVLAIGVALLFLFDFLLRLLRGSVIERAGREMDMVLGGALYEQLLAMEMQARPASSAMLAARARAYEIVREFFMSAAMLAITDLPFSLAMMSVMFHIAAPLGWVLVFAAVVAIVSECLIQMPLRRSVQDSSEAGMERQAVLSETVNGLESVKGACAEGLLQHRFNMIMSGSAQREGRSHWYALLGTSFAGVVINLSTVAVVVVSVGLIHANEMSMGGMVAAIMLTSRTLMPLAQVAGLMTRLQQALQALHSLNAIMGMPRETGGRGRKFVHRPSFRFNYELRDVKVKYPAQKTPALDGITLRVREGERIGLLGRIGSGKSTLMRLLAKLYEPAEGTVLLDDVELAQYHPAVVRRLIGYLPQNATIFRGTLRENIALGAGDVSDDEVLQAARLAGLGDYVRRHPLGMHAVVGEQGSMLSGGQRQAVVLARSLLRNPRLLLLDEPTSSMDPQTEKQFMLGLHQYLAQDPRRTLIVSTHNHHMLELVDRLIILEQGRILIDGEKGAVLARLAHPTALGQAVSEVPVRAETPASGAPPPAAAAAEKGRSPVAHAH